jgi:uncharacterized protein (DUF1015 family)
MAVLVPFAALRPIPSSAARVAAVPYDVVTTDEARALASAEPLSFLHVSRAEVDLPPGTSPYSDEVYAKAVTNLLALRRDAPLIQEESRSLYVYRLEIEGHSQTGVAGGFSIDDYERNLIRRHERTRKDKEDDRTRHIVELRAQTGPVFLVHRPHDEVSVAVARIAAGRPLYEFVADDGVRHTMWQASPADADALQRGFASLDALYIADGHHRAASAARARREVGGSQHFLAVAFPEDQVRILPYNRVVLDFGTHDAESFVRLLRTRFSASEGPAVPDRPGLVSVFVKDRWYLLPLDTADGGDGQLDVARLNDLILGPVLGIGDVTRDKRIDFVGGARGTAALERMVRAGDAAVAFSMHPVSMRDIMQVSDAGGIMPPKSTWFEPKLRDGLLSLPL